MQEINNQKQAQNFASLWAGMINEKKVDDVISLYQHDSILMPTFSPYTVKEESNLRDYFVKLGSRDGLAVKLHEETIENQHTGANIYVITGIYSFQFNVDNTLLTFPSRFTFVVDLDNKKPIIHHHSSQVPRTLS